MHKKSALAPRELICIKGLSPRSSITSHSNTPPKRGVQRVRDQTQAPRAGLKEQVCAVGGESGISQPSGSGRAVIVEFKTQMPGNYTMVDHALSRLERGLASILTVEEPPNSDIYNGEVMPGMGH